MQETAGSQRDVALEEMTSPTIGEEPKEKTKTLEKQEQLCELSRALAVLASASVRIDNNLCFDGLTFFLLSFLFAFTHDVYLTCFVLLLLFIYSRSAENVRSSYN